MYFQTETALLYDSVKLFANALIDLDQSQSVTMPSKTTSCIDMNPWLYGTSLMNYMRQITFQGVTGIVGFDQQGKRNNFILDVVSITSKGLQKVSKTFNFKLINAYFYNVFKKFI